MFEISDVFILPTAGTYRSNELETMKEEYGWLHEYLEMLQLPFPSALQFIPDSQARNRIHAWSNFLQSKPRAVGAIIGGYPDNLGISLAVKYFRYAEWFCPDLMNRVNIVDGSQNNTVDDIKAIDPLLKQEAYKWVKIHFVSYRRHYLRITPTLKQLGYNYDGWMDSGEKPVLNPIIDKAMIAITNHDPLWEHIFGKWLRRRANLNAQKYRDQCTATKVPNLFLPRL